MATLTWKGKRAYAVQFLGRVDGKQKFESHPLGKFERKTDGKIAFLEWLKWHDKRKSKKEFFEIVAEKYLNFCKANKAETTYLGEVSYVKILKKEFGDLLLNEITVSRIEAYKHKKPNWKVTTWRNVLGTLRKIFRYAKNHGFEADDPFTTVKIPSPKLYEFPTRAVSIDMLDKLIDVIQDPYKSILGVMRYTGARPIEVLRLKPDDIDFKHQTVRLYGKRKFRTIKVPKECLEYLKKAPFKFITTSLAHAMQKRCEDWSLPNISPYMFRHSVATYLGQQKFTLREIQEFLGQSTPAITARYTTVTQESFERAAETLGRK